MNIERQMKKLKRLEKKLEKPTLADLLHTPVITNRYARHIIISKIQKKKLGEKIEKLKKLINEQYE